MAKQQVKAEVHNLVKVLSKRSFRERHSGVLRCLVDADSHKMAQKIFYTHISDTDFSKFPLFLQKFDNLLHGFGASTMEKPTIEEDGDTTKKNSKKKRNRSKG